MGIAERRKIQELQQTVFPERQREIAEICGAEIPYDVDWESLASDAEALNFIDNVSCHRVNMALRTICVDDLGRTAVREGLRRIALRNVAEPTEMRMTFADGTLTMHCAYARRSEGMFSDSDIRKLLEERL